MPDSSWLTAGSPVLVLHTRISGSEQFHDFFKISKLVTATTRAWPHRFDFVRLWFERGRGGGRVSAWHQLALPARTCAIVAPVENHFSFRQLGHFGRLIINGRLAVEFFLHG